MANFSESLGALLSTASREDIAEAAKRLNASPAVMPEPQPNPDPEPIFDLDPNKVPGANFDLSLWRIAYPVDSKGSKTGTALTTTVGQSVRPPYFMTGPDGAMVFFVPVDGATTSGSKYPRCELRELTASGDSAAWTIAQGGTLSATLAINEAPLKSTGAPGRMVIGQIHGPDDELCRLYYEAGKLYFIDDKATTKKIETTFILKSSDGKESAIPIGDKFNYTIKTDSKNLVVTAVHNGVVYSATDPISSFWPGKACYFKAGLYLGVGKPGSGAGTVGSGQGKASFYRLTRPSHP